MLKKIKHMKCEDIMVLTAFVNINTETFQYPEKDEDYRYKDLLYISSQKENSNNEVNVEKDIDKLMFDNYSIYIKIKQKMKENDEMGIEDQLDGDIKKSFLESKRNIERYIKLYEKLMFEIKFEYADIRSVQKYLLQEKMNQEIKRENYELCSEIKKKIEEV